MDISNPQTTQKIVKNNKTSRKIFLQKPIDSIYRNQLNDSSSKMQFSFPKGDRFQHKTNSVTPDKFYQLPQVLRTQRSSSFGYGKKTQFGKQGKFVPSPGQYQILRQFQGNLKKGSTMGLSRQQVKFNDMFKISNNTAFPQPASYNVYLRHHTPKYTIGERFSHKKKWIDFVPGPGNYNHQQPTSTLQSTISNFRSSPATKFGKTLRLKQLQTTSLRSPGPGNYHVNTTTIKKQGTTFGKSQRSQPINRAQILSPGPGSYNMFSTFLN